VLCLLALLPPAVALAGDLPTPTAAPEAEFPDAPGATLEERYLRALHAGGPAAAKAFRDRCTPALARAAPEATLAALAGAIGPLAECLALGADGRSPDVRLFRVRGPGGAALVEIALDERARVAGLRYRPLEEPPADSPPPRPISSVAPGAGERGAAPAPATATGSAAGGPASSTTTATGTGSTTANGSDAVTGTATATAPASEAAARPGDGPRPAGPSDDHAARTRLTLPFTGRWTVGNGGRDPAKNHHVGNRNQWYAYDFVRPHRGDGRALEDYEAFGAEVIAPADGVIARVVDGVPDLPPGEADPYVIPGNHVVIDHKNGEWSFLCHFKEGSICVRENELVLRGAVLGLCGNSGNTSEPHIHYHLADDPVLHRGNGLPAPFSDLLVDGVRAERAEPERGRAVESAPAK
jgi:murein DD-endopeptidase MepM/ murein hydrolase activator NlpD